jgi:Zn-dependent M28 family amino/carboxypeptidase
MEQSTDKTDVRMKSTRRTFLSAGAVAAAVVTAGPLISSPAFADGGGAAPGPGGPLHAQKPDRELRKLLAEVDHRRIEATVNRLVAFGTRHTASSQTDPVRGIGAATTWVVQQMQIAAAASGGRMTVERQTFTQPVSPQIPVPTQITNVITTLRGDVSPDRIYVVTAHLDSRVTNVLNFTDDAPGADDDGSGVAVLIELARLMATRQFEATIVFGIVAGEEQGIYGSAFMAQQMKAAGDDIQAMFSNDIVGASSAFDGTKPDPHTLRLFVEGVPTSETANQTAIRQAVGGENDGPSRQLGRFVSSVADNSDTDMRIRVIWRRDRYLRGSDHISFLDQGYPAARFTEPRENFNHEHNDVGVIDGVQHGDLAEFCDFNYMARVAKVNATTLWSLAQAPGTPKNALLLTESLTNLSTLSWDRGTEPDLAGYEVVWRETTAPDWTNVIAVGDVTTITIDLSKDNVFFGVRAVDQAGHRSPVASPQPG